MREFITFEETRELIKQNTPRLNSIYIPVLNSVGFVLADDIFSPVDLPLWTNSAVDGYAIRTDSLKQIPTKLKIKGEIKAGEPKIFKLKEGEAVKVFTGSVIPQNTDAVIEKEKVKTDGNYIIVSEKPEKGKNIRKKGEEIKRGQKVINKGTEITPEIAGFISSMGIKKVKVFRKPEIFVIITGSEIINPGEKLRYGKIYDSNSVFLYTVLKNLGLKFELEKSKDDAKRIKTLFERSIKKYDIIIFTGGISVGDYDFVRDIIKNKIEVVFYKVKQKPGKPLLFGTKGSKLIFALPGNPAAVITCFWEYVYPAIRKMIGFSDIFPPEVEKLLKKDIKKNADRLYFLRARVDGEIAEPFENQDSHMLSSFVGYNSFILAPAGENFIPKGQMVKVHLVK